MTYTADRMPCARVLVFVPDVGVARAIRQSRERFPTHHEAVCVMDPGQVLVEWVAKGSTSRLDHARS
jgi:hypothetical protein